MESGWQKILKEGKKQSEDVMGIFTSNNQDEQTDVENELDLYLKLSKEGRSVLRNLKDRKEFYRPDLYCHLLHTTVYKEFPEIKGIIYFIIQKLLQVLNNNL